MSYEEFWEKDYRLVESYVKKHEMDIERETQSNWELVSYIRAALLEQAIITTPRDPKKPAPKFEFPASPSPRTLKGQLEDERNKKIASEIKEHYNQILLRRKAESDGND